MSLYSHCIVTVALVQIMRYTGVIQLYTVWVKKSPLRDPTFLHFFTNGWEFVIDFFTHLLNVPIFARSQIFIQLSPILTKLCHIKRDNAVHIMCTKCPKRARSDVCVSRWRLCWSLSVGSHYKINTFIMSINMYDMAWVTNDVICWVNKHRS